MKPWRSSWVIGFWSWVGSGLTAYWTRDVMQKKRQNRIEDLTIDFYSLRESRSTAWNHFVAFGNKCWKFLSKNQKPKNRHQNRRRRETIGFLRITPKDVPEKLDDIPSHIQHGFTMSIFIGYVNMDHRINCLLLLTVSMSLTPYLGYEDVSLNADVSWVRCWVI